MTEKQKIGWKVVSWERKSYIMWNTAARKHYLKRRKVTPSKNCGPLCVFKTKKSAVAFCPDSSRVKKCLYTPSKLEKVWNRKVSFYLDDLPNNTALADSVTCLE